MTDIVERLRRHYMLHPLMNEAADEIERLRAEVDSLQRKLSDDRHH